MARGGSNGGGVGGEIGTFDYVDRRRRHRRLRAGQPALGRSGGRACCCSRPAARTTTSGSTSRSATSTPRTTRAPTGASRPRPSPALNGRALNYPRGKVLGGCSSINGMIYMRGQARDYDQLAPAGQLAAGAGTTCCPTSRSPRTTSHGADEMHGAGGEWRVEEQRLSWEILDAFREAAAEVGIPQDRRLQPRRQRGLRLLPGQPEARRALEHRQGVPAPGARAAEPHAC